MKYLPLVVKQATISPTFVFLILVKKDDGKRSKSSIFNHVFHLQNYFSIKCNLIFIKLIFGCMNVF